MSLPTITAPLQHNALEENLVLQNAIVTFGTDPFVGMASNGQNPTANQHSAIRKPKESKDSLHILYNVTTGSLNKETLTYSYGVTSIAEKVQFVGNRVKSLEIEITSIQCGPKISCIVCGFITGKRREFEQMATLLKQWWPVGDLRVASEPESRHIYLAKFDKYQCLFRVQLIGKDKNKLKVLYIDYGSVDNVDCLYLIPTGCAVDYFKVARTPPFAIPFLVAEKPRGWRKFTENSTNTMFITEGQIAKCSLNGVAVGECAFEASVSIHTAKGHLNLKEILVLESCCCCIL